MTSTATTTATTYRCSCGAYVTTADEFPTCDATDACGLLFDDEAVPTLAVGDVVSLHHAKGKNRKSGTVTYVGRTRCRIEVPYLSYGHSETTRSISDPDLVVLSRANRRGDVAR
jgi:hypothetical protein